MEQQELRQLEALCVQEEKPPCIAACPLHLDARAIANSIARGSWDKAWRTMTQVLPLPRVLALLCEAPCRGVCNRVRAGEAVAMGGLERFLAANLPPGAAPTVFPAKNKSIAIWGSGISSLVASWDLARKGYKVTVFAPGPDPTAGLRDKLQAGPGAEALDTELVVMQKMGVVFECGLSTPGGPELWERLLQDHDGLFLGQEESLIIPTEWGSPDPMTMALARDGAFAGGTAETMIMRAAQGRWGALSLDRHVQRVSLSAGRENQGPYESSLHTNLERIEPLPMVVAVDQGQGYTQEEARREAQRCLQCQCLECVKSCVFLEEYKGYPKRYVREVYNNESIVMGQHQANTMVNSCTLCGLCGKICPNDFPLAQVFLESRRRMAAKGKMPPSAHEFALLDMDYSNGEDCVLIKKQPGTQTSRHLFFPGCQLSASSPQSAKEVYKHLMANLEGGVALMLQCCGAPAQWAGRPDLFADNMRKVHDAWIELDRPRIIFACPTCQGVFAKDMPEFEAISLWELLASEAPLGSIATPQETFTLHDPCTARELASVRAGVRTLLANAGIRFDEPVLTGEYTQCCGFGGLMQSANPPLARKAAQNRASQSPRDFVTYCAMCRDNLAAAGKRTAHVLELLTDAPQDPAGRPWPGWTARRENRARMKKDLLKELWLEDSRPMEEWETIELHMTDEVRTLVDQRRILDEDLRQVIHRAEKTSRRLKHKTTGHLLASWNPLNITFWVEYTPESGGYRVWNAYSHRMTVTANQTE